jgi:hypothetical protein
VYLTVATDRELWEDLLAADRALLGRNWAFLNGAADPAAVVSASLRASGETGAALRYLSIAAPDTIKRAVLPQLMFLAVGSNSDTVAARSIISSLPRREEVIAAVLPLAEELLADGDDETYLRIAELYAELSDELLQKHLQRCAAHPDPMVRDVPTYFDD